MGLATAAAILSGIGSISAGQAVGKQAAFQAAVNEQQAARERQISVAEEEDFRRRQSAALAERRAAGGAAGVELGTGSPLLAAGDFAAETELQALRIRAGGKTRVSRLEQQAELTRRAGRSAATRGFLRGGASLLSGFADFNDRKRVPVPTSADPRIDLF